MPKRFRKFTVYGAFGTKAKAKRVEHAGKGRFILERKIKGHKRYIVMKQRSR
jgi:hypothetical protein